jgi:hypothetical protein
MSGRTDLRELWRALQVQWHRLDTDPRVPTVLVGMVGGIGLVVLWAAVRDLWAAQWARTLLALLLGGSCLALVWLHLALTATNHNQDTEQREERP